MATLMRQGKEIKDITIRKEEVGFADDMIIYVGKSDGISENANKIRKWAKLQDTRWLYKNQLHFYIIGNEQLEF